MTLVSHKFDRLLPLNYADRFSKKPHYPISARVARRNARRKTGKIDCEERTGVSKKLTNHAARFAMYMMFYNFARVHRTLRITPAMAAGVSDHVWSIEETVGLLDAAAVPMKRGPYKRHAI